jgi:hypothetical protein
MLICTPQEDFLATPLESSMLGIKNSLKSIRKIQSFIFILKKADGAQKGIYRNLSKRGRNYIECHIMFSLVNVMICLM